MPREYTKNGFWYCIHQITIWTCRSRLSIRAITYFSRHPQHNLRRWERQINKVLPWASRRFFEQFMFGIGVENQILACNTPADVLKHETKFLKRKFGWDPVLSFDERVANGFRLSWKLLHLQRVRVAQLRYSLWRFLLLVSHCSRALYIFLRF